MEVISPRSRNHQNIDGEDVTVDCGGASPCSVRGAKSGDEATFISVLVVDRDDADVITRYKGSTVSEIGSR